MSELLGYIHTSLSNWNIEPLSDNHLASPSVFSFDSEHVAIHSSLEKLRKRDYTLICNVDEPVVETYEIVQKGSGIRRVKPIQKVIVATELTEYREG